jgi:hypothetical protein
MSTAAANNEAEILSRIIAPGKPELPVHSAEMILALDFPEEDRQRMNQLAERARESSLTPEEQLEIDAYERVGHFLSLLQSKARISLKKANRKAE